MLTSLFNSINRYVIPVSFALISSLTSMNMFPYEGIFWNALFSSVNVWFHLTTSSQLQPCLYPCYCSKNELLLPFPCPLRRWYVFHCNSLFLIHGKLFYFPSNLHSFSSIVPNVTIPLQLPKASVSVPPNSLWPALTMAWPWPAPLPVWTWNPNCKLYFLYNCFLWLLVSISLHPLDQSLHEYMHNIIFNS